MGDETESKDNKETDDKKDKNEKKDEDKEGEKVVTEDVKSMRDDDPSKEIQVGDMVRESDDFKRAFNLLGAVNPK